MDVQKLIDACINHSPVRGSGEAPVPRDSETQGPGRRLVGLTRSSSEVAARRTAGNWLRTRGNGGRPDLDLGGPDRDLVTQMRWRGLGKQQIGRSHPTPKMYLANWPSTQHTHTVNKKASQSGAGSCQPAARVCAVARQVQSRDGQGPHLVNCPVLVSATRTSHQSADR